MVFWQMPLLAAKGTKRVKYIRILIPVGAALAAFLATSVLSFGTQTYAKKEKKPCTTCHEPGKATKESPLLNATGKQYQTSKTLPPAK